jgi:hypothetical protein
METNWAAENLQTIRLLMERSAIYRRALAPIMVIIGCIGLASAALARGMNVDSTVAFTLHWTTTSLVAFIIAFLFVRKQALKDAEPFWSLPTRRVWQALLPNFLVGLVAGLLFLLPTLSATTNAWILPPVWMLFYGCGLHSAGFFMQRSIKWLGWVFTLLGIALTIAELLLPQLRSIAASHLFMGLFFGAFHLIFGFYLFVTEKQNSL